MSMRTKEPHLRETRRSVWRVLDDLRVDLRLALRTWRRNPVWRFVVTTILTVGIGVSTAAFTLINDEFFLPPVGVDPGSFAQAALARTTTQEPPVNFGGFTIEDVEAIQQRSKSLAQTAAWRPVAAPLEEDASTVVAGKLVTCNIFAVNGPVRPLLGRLLDQSDCLSAARVAVISESLWRNRFSSDPGVIGRVVSYNGAMTIVGVTPPLTAGWSEPALWLPYTLWPAWNMPRSGQAHKLTGRLTPGHSRAPPLPS